MIAHISPLDRRDIVDHCGRSAQSRTHHRRHVGPRRRRRLVPLRRSNRPDRQSPTRTNIHRVRAAQAPIRMVGTLPVTSLLRWYRDGADIAVRMPALSTYLGHGGAANTYWYLSSVSELLACAATRLAIAGAQGQVGSRLPCLAVAGIVTGILTYLETIRGNGVRTP